MKPLDLAKVFSDLANDPPWGSIGVILLAEARIRQARLALMLVEETAKRYGNCSGWMETSSGAASKMKDIFKALNEWGINPDHYGKVKERVDEADTQKGETLND